MATLGVMWSRAEAFVSGILSPLTSSFVTEGLSNLLLRASASQSIHGYHLCSNAPIISHLLFANDTLIFCEAKETQATAIKDVLFLYEQASGQLVNYSKTTVSFS